jgi:soluble lytic murein transglycosylase
VKLRINPVLSVFIIIAGLFLAGHKQAGRYLYPLEYREQIFRHAADNGLDPFLVTAIIKVESGFRSDALSPRGAVGLMQLMPQTGVWIAAQRGETYAAEHLLDPETNIRFGAWYLAYLNQEFEDAVIALAAYNGGRGNVRKWLSERTWSGMASDLDQIPFPETRQFVRKTVWTHRVYTYLYPEADRS